jgi:hypothetical protein
LRKFYLLEIIENLSLLRISLLPISQKVCTFEQKRDPEAVMPKPTQAPAMTGLLSVLLFASITPVDAQSNSIIPTSKPDLTLKVVRQTGICPQQVSLWTAARQYEGGAETTVIANTLPIAAAAAKLVSSKPQLIEYSALLKQAFASCVAQAGSGSDLPYRFRFQQGKVFFQIDLRSINRNPSTPAVITYKAILNSRPYVRWAIAD